MASDKNVQLKRQGTEQELLQMQRLRGEVVPPLHHQVEGPFEGLDLQDQDDDVHRDLSSLPRRQQQDQAVGGRGPLPEQRVLQVLPRNVLAAEVNGSVVDANLPIATSASLKLLTWNAKRFYYRKPGPIEVRYVNGVDVGIP